MRAVQIPPVIYSNIMFNRRLLRFIMAAQMRMRGKPLYFFPAILSVFTRTLPSEITEHELNQTLAHVRKEPDLKWSPDAQNLIGDPFLPLKLPETAYFRVVGR